MSSTAQVNDMDRLEERSNYACMAPNARTMTSLLDSAARVQCSQRCPPFAPTHPIHHSPHQVSQQCIVRSSVFLSQYARREHGPRGPCEGLFSLLTTGPACKPATCCGFRACPPQPVHPPSQGRTKCPGSSSPGIADAVSKLSASCLLPLTPIFLSCRVWTSLEQSEKTLDACKCLVYRSW